MSSRRLKDLMPKRPRCHESLPKELEDRLASLYQRLREVPYIGKQQLENWLERFCHGPEPEREIAVWEWLAGQYEQRSDGVSSQDDRNRIFRDLLTEAIDYEPLGVRKLPE